MGNLPKANKNLGQHFLVDQNIISKITTDLIDGIDEMIEVGPGPAVLTRHLAKHEFPFHVVEKDTRFEELLEEFVEPDKIHITDALEFDWNKIICANKNYWLVSNLPYNVSVPLLLSFTKQERIISMTLMFQKEVGQKVVWLDPSQKKNQMSSLMALCQNYFECTTLCKVPPGAFSPPPKVDSIVVSFRRKANPIVSLQDFRYFESFLRTLFAFKRKQIRSVLKSIALKGKDGKNLEEILSEVEIPTNTRAETLSMEQIYRLYHMFDMSL